MGAHSSIAVAVFGSEEEEVEQLRTDKPLTDPKSEKLRTFARAVYQQKGRVSDDELQAFLDAGFTRAQALDVVTNIAAKVMTNFANQLALTPVDEAFQNKAKDLPYAEERAVKTSE